MATNYTTLLGFALPTTGELSGTWGTVVNDNITELVEDSIAATATASVTSGDWTLTTTGSGAANQARCAILIPTGTPGTSRNIIVPSQSKAYFVINQSDAAVVVKGSATTGVTIAAGKNACVAWDASDFVKVASNELVSLTAGVSGTLPVGNGGTGTTSGTSGGVLYYSASNTLASSGALANDNFVIGGGAGAAPETTSLLALSAAVTTGTFVKAVGYADTVTALGNTGTAINVDVTSGGVFTATLTGSCTFTLRYPVSSGASSFVLILTNDGTAGRTVAFAGGTFKYPDGSVTRTTTANATDIWFFMTPDGGTTYYVSIPMKNLS